jgi:HK97 gp10 family phage protein
MHLEGADQVEALLKRLPSAVSKRVTTASLRSGATVIAKAARAKIRANPSIDSGLLVKKIVSRTVRRPSKGQAQVTVGVAGGASMRIMKGHHKPRKKIASRYAHLVEFGTEHSPAEPFMRPAVDSQGSAAVAKVVETAGKLLARETAKLAPRKR